MTRQNDGNLGVYAELRTLEPWWVFRETHTSALGYAANDLHGLNLGRGLMPMEHLVVANGWTLTSGGDGTRARFDDREIGDGTALERTAATQRARAPRPLPVAEVSVDERGDAEARVPARLSTMHIGLTPPVAERMFTPGKRAVHELRLMHVA